MGYFEFSAYLFVNKISSACVKHFEVFNILIFRLSNARNVFSPTPTSNPRVF
jgi:hypothetical protein